MSTLVKRAFATGARRCKVLDFEGNCVRVVNINMDDLAAARVRVRNEGYRLVPIAEVSENIHEIMNTSRYGRE
jgi:hypothetical protein